MHNMNYDAENVERPQPPQVETEPRSWFNCCRSFFSDYRLLIGRAYDVCRHSDVLFDNATIQWIVVFIHFCQLLATLILFVALIKHLSAAYIWWPAVDCIRVAAIATVRIDRLIATPDLQFLNTQRSVICLLWLNILGGFWGFPMWFIYVGCLPPHQTETAVFVLFTAVFLFFHTLVSCRCIVDTVKAVLRQPSDINSPYQRFMNSAINTTDSPIGSDASAERAAAEQFADDYAASLQHSILEAEAIERAEEEQQLREAAEQRVLRERQDAEYEAAIQAHISTMQPTPPIAPLNETEQNLDTETEIEEMKGLPHSMTPAMSPETELDDPTQVIHIRFRLPNGKRVSRKFLISDDIQKLYRFVNSLRVVIGNEIVCDGKYVLATNYPRRIYSERHETIENTHVFTDGNQSGADKITVSPMVFVEFTASPRK